MTLITGAELAILQGFAVLDMEIEKLYYDLAYAKNRNLTIGRVFSNA